MQPGTTLLIVGQNRRERNKKLAEILGEIFPRSGKINPNLIRIEGNIGIDNIRNFKIRLSRTPYSGAIQLGCLEIENITTEAQNALLKLIEEPPATCQIIICSNSVNELLPTIVSRCSLIFTTDYSDFKFNAQTLKEATIISQDNLGEKFALASKLAKGDLGLWLDNQLIFWHDIFLAKLEVGKVKQNSQIILRKISLEKTIKVLKNLTTAKSLVKLNVNSRLLLENLFLSI